MKALYKYDRMVLKINKIKGLLFMSNTFENKLTHKGKPAYYMPEYCNEILEFFDKEPFEERTVMKYYKNGDSEEKIQLIPCILPTLTGFAFHIGVSAGTLQEWSKEHTEFLEAIEICKAKTNYILVTNSLKGLYNPAVAIFTAKNLIGWSDKQQIEHSGTITHKKLEDFYSNEANKPILADRNKKLVDFISKKKAES